jgi:thymidylate kinase
METYHTWIRLFELQRYYSWIIDRFHISTMMHQRKYCGRHYDLQWIEERLLPLGFHIVFCYRSPESFEEAKQERLKVSGNPKQYDNINIFFEEQQMLSELVEKSILPKLYLDVSSNNIKSLSNSVADWMEQNCGLFSKQ